MGTQEAAPKRDNWKVASVSMESKPMGWSILALLAMILVAVAPEIKDLASWQDAFTPAFVGQHFYIWGSVLGAWVAGFMRNKK